MKAIPLHIYIGRIGAQVYLNGRRIAGPIANLDVDAKYEWQVSATKVRKVLDQAPDETVPFVFSIGSQGIQAKLGKKVLAGKKRSKSFVPVGRCEVPICLLQDALDGKPEISLECGAHYATADAQKVMIYKRSDDNVFYGVFVDSHGMGAWYGNGEYVHQGRFDNFDIIGRWDEVECLFKSS